MGVCFWVDVEGALVFVTTSFLLSESHPKVCLLFISGSRNTFEHLL